MSFAYDRVTGQAFRGSEFSIRARNRILKSSDADALVFLSPDPRKDAEDLSQIYSALEGDNEVIIGSDSSPHLPIEGYAVVRVMGGVIDDVSARAEQPLRSAILKAASELHGRRHRAPECRRGFGPALPPGSTPASPGRQKTPATWPNHSFRHPFLSLDRLLRLKYQPWFCER
jgi:hypothetical protein